MSSRRFYIIFILLCVFISVEARWLPGGIRDRESFYTPSTSHNGDTLKLKWIPSLDVDHFDSLPNLNCDKKIVVHQIVDKRIDKNFLGKNIEEDIHKVLYVKDLALWYKQNLNNTIKSECGDDGNKDVYYVIGSIVNFEIIESSLYICKLTMQVIVISSDFKPVWNGVINTENSDWGTSFNQFNYNQILSNSINCLAANILSLKMN